jgi:signal transduction histidine kinase
MNNIIFVDDDREVLTNYKSLFEKKSSSVLDEADTVLGLETERRDEETQYNYNIFCKSQGIEAVEVIKKQFDKNNPIKVAFIDMRMPPGINGAETTRRIRKIDPNIEVVIVTAYSDTDLKSIIKEVGQPDKLLYLRKPFDPEEIKQLALNLTEKYDLERIKDKFLANVTHELNTPISSILGFSGMLADHDDLSDDEKQEFFEIINKNAKLMSLLVDDLLTITQFKDNKIKIKKENASINTLMKDLSLMAKPLFTKNNNLEFSLNFLDKDVSFPFDVKRMQQCLLNLLSNAIKFTDNGQITLKAKNVDQFVYLSVCDSGIGIPENKTNIIFDRFVRVEDDHHEKPGLGLGLSIIKEIVKLHGDEIFCKNNSDKGTTFTIKLKV